MFVVPVLRRMKASVAEDACAVETALNAVVIGLAISEDVSTAQGRRIEPPQVSQGAAVAMCGGGGGAAVFKTLRHVIRR
jgi:hypothetical protein